MSKPANPPSDLARLEADVRASFEKLWREVDEREKREAASAVGRRVRLECNGELVDIGSVGLAGLRRSALGTDVIQFHCPRCDQIHESVRIP